MSRQASTAFVRVGYWLTVVSLLLWLILKAWDFLPSWAHEHAPWLIALVIVVLALWAVAQVLEREWGKLIGVGLAGLAFALVSNIAWLQPLLEAVAAVGLFLFVLGLVLSLVWYWRGRAERKHSERAPYNP